MASQASVKVVPAEVLEESSYQAQGKLTITEHHFRVPLNHHDPSKGSIRLFASSAKPHKNPVGPETGPSKPLPWMVWLTGGPGQPCQPPQAYPFTQLLLEKGYAVLCLDQRGTGLSTPVTASTLAARGSVLDQAEYMKLFRADSIVRDCEAVRLALTEGREEKERKWSVFGQSFGGFISVSYLSLYPEGLKEAFLFGGLMPLVTNADEVYRRLFKRLREKNEVFYRKFPGDERKVKRIVNFLNDGDVRLPSGGRLTARAFLGFGIQFGFHRGIDHVHNIVLKAAHDLELFGHLTRNTLSAIEAGLGWEDCLIYSMLHEAIYMHNEAPRWSAQRVKDADYPEFSLARRDTSHPLYFTGEMIFPWMFEDFVELAKVREVADRLARDSAWPALYDVDRLKRNEVPVYAAAYIEDMYVDYEFSKETASTIKGCKMFATNVMYHNAIRDKCKEVVDQLFALRDDVVD